MKVAFVSQAIDSVLPPYQNSIGACTYGSACALAGTSEVVVFALKAANNERTNLLTRNVTFHFVESAATDYYLQRIRTRLSRAVQLQPESTSSLYYPNYGLKVAHELSRENCDVIHIQHSSQYIPLIRKFNPKAKIVLHLHAEWFSQSKTPELLQRIEALDLLTSVSDYVSTRVACLLPNLGKPCITHYNGIDPLEFAREKDYAALSERRLRHIMFAGAISPHKGLHVLIDAFKIVAADCPDVRLNLIGPQATYEIEETFDVQDQSVIRELAPFYRRDMSVGRKLLSSGSSVVPDYVAQLKARLPSELADKVVFFGQIPRERLIDQYYDADLFVFPSLFAEGFGLPPVEAMAAGTPAIGTRSGAIVETIEDGVTGLLVEKNDPQALAHAMLKLLGSATLREEMGRAGRRRVLDRFTWDHVAAKMIKTYQRLCSKDAIPI